jgi:adenine-specific DNA-methyltransferase
MSSEELRTKIVRAIKSFKIQEYYLSADKLLACMGYTSNRRLPLQEKTPHEFLDSYNKEGKLNEQKALIEKWRGIDLLFQLTGPDLKLLDQSALPLPSEDRINQNITSYLFFALELQDVSYTRTEVSNITREINKCFHIPVMLVVKHGTKISIAIIHRRPNKRESDKDVLEKVTLIKDININHPHRAHIEILADLSLQEIISKPSPPKNIEKLHEVWRSLLDLKELNKNFYKELSNWYFWAIKECTFPEEAGADETRNPTSIIRLITRLIFIWFIKEKGLVPDGLFDKIVLQNTLTSLKKEESTYYKAILQNLFFATLNQEDLGKRQFVQEETFQGKNHQYGVFNVFRYKDFFTKPEQALDLFKDIPFLNGGLFECLDHDREVGESVPDGLEKEICRIDGFSGRSTNPLSVPNKLFFSEEHFEDLNQDYGTSNKQYKASGLVDILHRYKFTIEENTPLEEEIALDPELLGRVFENLLAAYNPETQTTARKATGSYYTPREIVNYMVDESLIAYFDQKLIEFNPKPKTHALVSTQPPITGDQVNLSSETIIYAESSLYEPRLRRLFDYSEHDNPFDKPETDLLINAIDTIKVLDPACGSGAFPMGVLHRLVFLLGKLDEQNQRWKMRQLEKGNIIEDKEARERSIQAIKNAFETNELDYGRKLYLIQNCIYGVDIQPIAVQIAKLRFFISLIVDQKVDHHRPNWGIASLPNLESKFVAANSLLGIEKPDLVAGHQMALGDNTIEEIQRELFLIRGNYFNAHTREQKIAFRHQDKELRNNLAKELEQFGWSTTSAKRLAAWDPYAQNVSADFFDPIWIFGINSGFDIVIANPPYITYKGKQKIKSSKEYIKNLLNNFPNSAEYKINSFALFIDKGLRLMAQNGILSYIVPSTLFQNHYLKKIRKFIITKFQIKKIITFSNKVFESVTDSIILFIGNVTRDSENIDVSRQNDLDFHSVIYTPLKNI